MVVFLIGLGTFRIKLLIWKNRSSEPTEGVTKDCKRTWLLIKWIDLCGLKFMYLVWRVPKWSLDLEPITIWKTFPQLIKTNITAFWRLLTWGAFQLSKNLKKKIYIGFHLVEWRFSVVAALFYLVSYNS